MSAINRNRITTTAPERMYTTETTAPPVTTAAGPDASGGMIMRFPPSPETRLRYARATAATGPTAATRRAEATAGRDSGLDHHPVLPTASALICALAGQYLSGTVCRSAHQLVEIHHRTQVGTDSFEQLRTRRAELVGTLDRWARRLPPSAPAAHANSDSLGTLVDRIAEAAARAFHLLRTDDIGGEPLRAAWTRLAELELEYADLVREITARKCYLPPR